MWVAIRNFRVLGDLIAALLLLLVSGHLNMATAATVCSVLPRLFLQGGTPCPFQEAEMTPCRLLVTPCYILLGPERRSPR